MKTKDLILFVFDEEQHFQDNLEFLGKDSYRNIIRVDSLSSLEKELAVLNDNDYIFLATHAFFTDKIKGVQKFVASGIKEKYPLIGELYISEGSEKTIKKDMIEFEIPIADVHRYHYVRSSIEDGTIRVCTKKEVVDNDINTSSMIPKESANEVYDVDYVIITALEEDEMEKVLPMIKKTGKLDNVKHLIEYGYFAAKPNKKVAYASQLSTGMVDASILATEMLVRFNPKFLIMTGVLGGKPKDTKIGDVVVSTKVFTIDKGKISNDEFKRESENSNTDNSYVTSFRRHKSGIIQFINDKDGTRNQLIDIHFEPVACVRQVIDEVGYFEEKISTVDRKTIALEMEGYGIARACELINNGKTTPIIIKSVMDNTQAKTDGAKTYAAWTSSAFLEYIVLNDLI